jgi:hypothetical protein
LVAQPIQNMSALSITHKTVGIGLPRLRFGAVGWRIKLPITSHPVQSWDALAAEKVFGWKNVHTQEEFKSGLNFA